MVRDLKFMTYKGRPRTLSLVKFKRSRFRGNLTAVYNYTMEECGKGKSKTFSEINKDNMRSKKTEVARKEILTSY